MRHKEIEYLIHKKLDKEITKEEDILLFEHIDKCPECKEFYLEMERIKEEIFNLNEFFPDALFNARVISAIKAQKQILWYRTIPVFGVIYLVGLVILLFTPMVNIVFSRLLLKLPEFVQIFENIKLIGNGFLFLVSTFLKVNQIYIFTGFLLSLLIFYCFGRILKNKEAI